MRNVKRGFFSLIVVGVLFAYSCVKEEIGGVIAPDYWSPDFSFPIGRSTLAMDEVSGVDEALLLLNPLSGFPFWVEELEISLNDTFPFSFDAILEDEVERILIRLNTDNGFPATVTGQLYFMDAEDVILDSVFKEGALNLTAGQVIDGGETIDANFETNDAFMDRNKLDNIRTVEKIFIKGAIQNLTLDSTLIEYYSTYKLKVQVGIQIKFNFGSENLSY